MDWRRVCPVAQHVKGFGNDKLKNDDTKFSNTYTLCDQDTSACTGDGACGVDYNLRLAMVCQVLPEA